MASQGSVFSASMSDAIRDSMDKAIANEREECARIAESLDEGGDSLVSSTAKAIAVLIRSRK